MNIIYHILLIFIICTPYHLNSLYELQEPSETLLNGGECADKSFAFYSLTHNVSFCVGYAYGGSHAWCIDENNNIIECSGFGIPSESYTPYFILYPDGHYDGEFNQYTDKFI